MPEPAAAAPANAAQNWERTLAQFESMPREVGELKRSLGEVLHRFEDALDHLGIEARRLSNEASSLALVADRLQTRLVDLGQALGNSDAYHDCPPAREARPAPLDEPQFRPSDTGVTIILAGVPGFQGLMDVQRALQGLSFVEPGGVSVIGFKNDEATLRVVLREPASARQIVEGLQASLGQQVLIEEARPETQRLRLRFVEKESRR